MALYHEMRDILTTGGVAGGEAKALALALLEDMGGLSCVDVLAGREPDDRRRLLAAARRVAQGEPVQYVTGVARFCGMSLRVAPGVLIPRPETEELVALAAAARPQRVLDIGTGSGCIAIALAKMLAEAEVTAVDVSADALRIASENAAELGAAVRFVMKDILREDVAGEYELIVSNPPYICESEKADMEHNVLEHEPGEALFVPDSDPLLFYKRIADIAISALARGGMLAFEINRRFGQDVAALLSAKGFGEVAVKQDMFGNDRMVTAIKP